MTDKTEKTEKAEKKAMPEAQKVNGNLQTLVITCKSGARVAVSFATANAQTLNPQAKQFIELLGNPKAKGSNYLFQGAAPTLVRLDEVAAVQLTNRPVQIEVQKQAEAAAAPANAPKADKADKPAKTE